jgi:hypothetical protein
MTNTDYCINDSVEILIGELMTDEELREAFLRDPAKTLRRAGDWALPLCESELRFLRAPAYRRWEKVVEELEARL